MERKQENAKCAAMLAWFDREIAKTVALELRQRLNGQAAEAVFTHMEINIYRVFKKTFTEAVDVYGSDDKAVGDQFKQKLILIPAPWHTSVTAAVKNGDLEAAHVETRKIAAADNVKTAFYHIWETEAEQ